MKILHINISDNVGGASRAAYRLHQGLCQVGIDSRMFVLDKHANSNKIIQYNMPSAFFDRVSRHLRWKFRRYLLKKYPNYKNIEIFSDDRSIYGNSVIKQLPSCDIINLHWIADFIDYRSFFLKINNTPVVWTLHDMNAFTGGCHYDLGCGKYQTNCFECPQLGSRKVKDLSYVIWKRKKEIFENVSRKALHFITPSVWLGKAVKKSTVLKRFPSINISYGIDTENFKPKETDIARTALEIPLDAKVILFCADSTSNTRKGFNILANILGALDNSRNIILLSIGRGRPEVKTGVNHLHLGHISNDRILSLIYNASDIYVIPSIQDNQPNTILEAFSCGLPVIGFDVGGIPELVRNNVTGSIVTLRDEKTFLFSILALLDNPQKLGEISHNCRRIVLDEYTLKKQAVRYANVYKKLMDNSSKKKYLGYK